MDGNDEKRCICSGKAFLLKYARCFLMGESDKNRMHPGILALR